MVLLDGLLEADVHAPRGTQPVRRAAASVSVCPPRGGDVRTGEAAVGVLGPAPVGAGYFVCSSGQVTDEVIAQYIKLQGAEPQDDDRFRVSEE